MRRSAVWRWRLMGRAVLWRRCAIWSRSRSRRRRRRRGRGRRPVWRLCSVLLRVIMVVGRKTPAAERKISRCAVYRGSAARAELCPVPLLHRMSAEGAELEITFHCPVASGAGHSLRLRSRDLFSAEHTEFGLSGVFVFAFRTLHRSAPPWKRYLIT